MMKTNKTIRSFFILFFLFTVLSCLKAEEKVLAKILSFNVLADHVHSKVRLPALFKILEKSDADIIGLQEVTPWFLNELEKQPWAEDYYSYRFKGKRVALGGLMVLSKSPITKIFADYLPSNQRRAYFIAETQMKGIEVTVGNCHLESPLESGKIRAMQLDAYFKMLSSAEHAIFLGDFNFGEGEQPETDKLQVDYVDSWKLTNTKELGFTWNIEKSHIARLGSFPMEKSRRIDRILMRSESFSPSKTEILGNTEITGHRGVFPSDHFGLLSTIILKK